MNISFMHVLGGIVIGLIVGRLFSIFTLRKVKGGKYTFMVAGVFGSLGGDAFFRILHVLGFVSNFYYKEVTIIFEMIGGACIASYLLSLLGKKEVIKF